MTETANYGAVPTSGDAVIPADVENFFDKYSRWMRIVVEGAQADTGQTPKETVWTKNKANLYHYAPNAKKKHPVPILMVYALINRPYILDLMPGNSFIEYLVGEGFDVYMLDWGVPGDEDKDLTFENYVLDYLPRAVKKVLRHSHSDELTVLGYCMGGTMSAMYASLFPEHLKDLIDTGNRMLKPVTNYVGTYVNMWERIFEEKPMETWLAMNKWVNDGPPFPGATFRQWITEFYQQNKLAKGEIVLRGRRVDLSSIDVPLLNIAGKKDHICTLPQAEATMNLVGSKDKEFFVLDAGHVGLMTGRGAKKGLWPKVSDWLSTRSG